VTTNNWDQIQMVKTSGPISAVTPQNAQPNNNGTVQAVGNPVREIFGNGFTLTYIFENGFGGIGAGMPGRMNNVLVSAGPKGGGNGQTRISLPVDPQAPTEVKWTTDSENESTFFEVEKSYDGIKFNRIATLNASRNSTSEREYSYTDKENVELNYYRVTLHHSDGRLITSNVAFVKREIAVQNMVVMSNPFRDQVSVRFTKLPTNPITLKLYDMQGRMIKSFKNGAAQTVVMDLGGEKLSGGVYVIDALVDGKHYREKVVKQ